MNQEQKQSNTEPVVAQDVQQLQITLKETLKENKSLQNKNTKLQGKYVELFKQSKLLKQDRQTLTSFLIGFFTDSQGKCYYQQPTLGQCTVVQIQSLSEQKLSSMKAKIEELQSQITNTRQNLKEEFQRSLKQELEKQSDDLQSRLKSIKDQKNKQVHSLQRQIQSLKKSLENRTNQLTQVKNTLQQKTQQLSKITKEKLKMQHHINNFRKKQIAQEITPPQQKDQSKTLIDKNQYLSLKQQIQSLLAKRDQLKRDLKKKEDQLQAEKESNQKSKIQLARLYQIQIDLKYELVRQCSLQDLQNMILCFHTLNQQKATETVQKQKSSSEEQNGRKISENGINEEQIQRQYFNNLVIRYIKAQISDKFQESITLLQIIGRLVKLDKQGLSELQQYKSKKKQWWFIKM